MELVQSLTNEIAEIDVKERRGFELARFSNSWQCTHHLLENESCNRLKPKETDTCRNFLTAG